jgi:hypothetical protein
MDGSFPGERFDQTSLSFSELADQISELAGHLNAGNYRWLKLIAEFDRRKGWSDWATQSCAHWLNWRCGIDMGAAREKVRVAHALENLPKISACMERGELSYSKVRALSRVAEPATEDNLLMIALHGTAHHVETVVRHYRRAKEAEELSREALQQANRCVTYYFDETGSLVLKARLPADVGAIVLKALDAAVKEIPVTSSESEETLPGVSAETPPGPPARTKRADALALMAESFLKHGAEHLSGGDRNQIVIHIDEEVLRTRTAGRCEIEHGPSIAAETARRLACDASVVPLVENGEGEPLNVGRKTRSIPPAMRRAINARDKGCRFPGCINKKYVDAHHIHHWADGGETKQSNLVSLCRFHHRTVHEGGIAIQVLDDGAFRFTKPNGESLDSIASGHTQPFSDWRQLSAQHQAHGIHVDEGTATSRWRGESIDYGLAIEVLLQRSHRARDISAETRVVGIREG